MNSAALVAVAFDKGSRVMTIPLPPIEIWRALSIGMIIGVILAIVIDHYFGDRDE